MNSKLGPTKGMNHTALVPSFAIVLGVINIIKFLL